MVKAGSYSQKRFDGDLVGGGSIHQDQAFPCLKVTLCTESCFYFFIAFVVVLLLQNSFSSIIIGFLRKGHNVIDIKICKVSKLLLSWL